MKAWQIGAVIGVLLGFFGSQSLTGVVLGAVIVAFFAEIINKIYIIFLPETESASWKKGAFFGGFWGFISFFGLFLVALGEEHGGPASILTYIIALPATLTIKLIDDTFLADTFYGLFILAPICSILVGALIGSIIGLSIEKFRVRRREA